VAIYFFDSSGLAKRYLKETGTAWVQSLTNPLNGNDCYVARITGVEVVAAVTRQHRSGSVSATDAAAVITDFRDDFQHEYRMVEITPALIQAAMALAEAHAIRGYDAVQLAAALELSAASLAIGTTVMLISADTALNTAAAAEGLAVEDPNAHL
jgi:uncharacterized protein